MQVSSGVIDVLVEDERECVAVAKQYLGYFRARTDRLGPRRPASAASRSCPRDRLRAYDISARDRDAGRRRFGA